MHTQSFIFTYEGDFLSFDTLTVLHTQLNFVSMVSEIKNQIYPEIKLDFKIKGLEKESLDVNHIFDVAAISGIFVMENYQYVNSIFKILGDIIKLKGFLKGKKADTVQENSGGMTVTISPSGDFMTITKDAFNIYQGSTIINNSLINTGKLLGENNDIDYVKIVKKLSKNEIIKIYKVEFGTLKEENAYLSRLTHEETYFNETLYIKKPNLFPEKNKKWHWEFIHKGRDIKACIIDKMFLDKINSGFKIGQGDRIIANLKIYNKFDERVNTFIESNKYEVNGISDTIISRTENNTLIFE